MKRGLIAFMICCCQYIACQNTWQRDSIIYMTAYKYIINDSINQNKLMVVADSIVDLDRYWVDGLEELPEERKILAQYKDKQRERYFIASTYYSPLLATLFPNQDVKRSNNILFFSNIDNMMLRADVNFFDKKCMSECEKFRYEAYMWGTSHEYLFIFNEDCIIKKVLWREVILN